MRTLFFSSFFSISLMAQISGTILDGHTQNPIEGALVRFQTRTTVVTTQADGTFILDDTGPGRLTGAAYGYFNGAITISTSGPVSGVTITLTPIDLTNEGATIKVPTFCATCHTTLEDQYSNSPMAKTGYNKWVHDIFNGSASSGGMNGFVYTRDSDHLAHSPVSECASCHTPVHFLNDPESGLGDFNDPVFDKELGVTCEICHRAYDVDENKTNWPGVIPADEGGAFTLIRSNEAMEFGRLGDVDNVTGMRGSYNPQLAARVCAACHEDNNDSDEDGDYEDEINFEGAVPSETTYSEWLDYEALNGENAKSCVDCHMPITDLSSFCSLSGLNRTGQVRSHDIRGTTPAFLDTALDFTVTHQVSTNHLKVDVTIANSETGHSVPTGVPIRNVILVLLVKDEGDLLAPFITGDQIDSVGGVDPNTMTFNIEEGYYAGLPGKAFYMNGANATHERVFFTESTFIQEDSRIKAGETYQGSFVFELPVGSDTLNVDVRLIYRRGFRDLVDTKQWITTGLGDPLQDIQPPFFGYPMGRDEEALNVCLNRDINDSGSVTIDDFDLLQDAWRMMPPPFGSEAEMDIRHLIAIVNCIDPI